MYITKTLRTFVVQSKNNTTMVTHFISSQRTDKLIQLFDTFNSTEIKNAIIKHLNEHPEDTIEHCKTHKTVTEENAINADYDIINFYEVNPKNKKPSLVITKGYNTYYKTLE